MSPFARYLGTGTDHLLEMADRELTEITGEPQGYHIRYTRWCPSEPSGRVIVYNHGLQSHRGWFYPTASDLVEQGHVVYALDRIGSGQSSAGLSLKSGKLIQLRGHIRSWRLFIDTLEQVVELAGRENPAAEIFVWGNSYGAKVVTAFLLDRARNLASLRVTGAIYTVPGLFQNKQRMPVTFSKLRLIFSSQGALFPAPMVPTDEDNGAHWFTSMPEWFDAIRGDKLSLRQATRSFWLQTALMDRAIDKESKKAKLPVPSLFLMVRDDRMMDNAAMERFIRERTSNSLFKLFSGGPDGKHFLLFTTDREEALADIGLFLKGLGSEIASATHVR